MLNTSLLLPFLLPYTSPDLSGTSWSIHRFTLESSPSSNCFSALFTTACVQCVQWPSTSLMSYNNWNRFYQFESIVLSFSIAKERCGCCSFFRVSQRQLYVIRRWWPDLMSVLQYTRKSRSAKCQFLLMQMLISLFSDAIRWTPYFHVDIPVCKISVPNAQIVRDEEQSEAFPIVLL